MKRLISILALAAATVQAQDRPAVTQVLTVSTTALGLSETTLGGTNGVQPRTVCAFTLETADIRYRVDGLDPDTNTGHVYAAGGQLSIEGNVNLRRLRVIRDGGSDATLTASCW